MEKLGWLTSTVFLELLGLSQCLPGPTSTQVSFAIGVVQKGVTGGLMTGEASPWECCLLLQALDMPWAGVAPRIVSSLDVACCRRKMRAHISCNAAEMEAD